MATNNRNLKSEINSYLDNNEKIRDEFLDILATAEIIYENKEDLLKDLGGEFDYSCIIILYCKAVEILERNKCIENIDDIIRIVKQYQSKIPMENQWIKRMIMETQYKKNPDKNIFHADKAIKTLVELLKLSERKQKNYSGDMFKYNSLLFLFNLNKMNEDRFRLINSIYWLYHKDRNGAAHTHPKNIEDAERVREQVIGLKKITIDRSYKEQISNSITYKLIHNLD